jgi:hypothetical protein
VDRLASDLCLAFDRCRLPQSGASLGVDVDSFLRHLFQPEVADLVEGAITHCSFGTALGSLSSGVMDAETFLDASQRVPSPPPTTWLWATFETLAYYAAFQRSPLDGLQSFVWGDPGAASLKTQHLYQSDFEALAHRNTRVAA